MQTLLLPHPDLATWLARDPVRNLFPRYVCQARPEGRSLAVIEDGRIRGAVVGGREFKIPFVQSDWLVADTAEAARALLADLAARDRLDGAQLAWEGATELIAEHPGYQVIPDVYLTRLAGPHPEIQPHGTLVQIDARAVATHTMALEIRAAIGNLATLPPDASLWGLAVAGRLVTLADTLVRCGDIASVQQVFCAYGARRQGHTRALLTWLLAHPSVAGMTLTWLANAENTASIRLARGLGFGDDLALACVERVAG